MPQKLLAANVIICETVLDQKDEVMSAIRIVDLMTLRIIPELPIEKQTVQLSGLVMVKSRIGDDGEHHIQVDLVRPNGEVTKLLERSCVATSILPQTPGGANFILQVALVPRQMGTHYFRLSVDGEEVTTAPFTLREPEQEPNKN
jgi:uncharacterized protein DUF6941